MLSESLFIIGTTIFDASQVFFHWLALPRDDTPQWNTRGQNCCRKNQANKIIYERLFCSSKIKKIIYKYFKNAKGRPQMVKLYCRYTIAQINTGTN